MKKTCILIFLFVSFCSYRAQAQASISFGLKGGVNSTKIPSSKVDASSVIGPVGGVYLRAKVLGFFIQPEAVYSVRGGQFTIPKTATQPSYTQTTKTSYIDVPVMAGMKFFKVLRLNAGPNFQFLMSAKTGSKDTKSSFNSFVAGYQAGIGIDIWKLGFDVRYDGNLSKISSKTLGYANSTRSSAFQMTVAFKLFGAGL